MIELILVFSPLLIVAVAIIVDILREKRDERHRRFEDQSDHRQIRGPCTPYVMDKSLSHGFVEPVDDITEIGDGLAELFELIDL